MRKTLGLGVLCAILYWLLLSPVPIHPLVWQAPANPGYQGVFEANYRLADVESLSIGEYHGPEDVVMDAQGRLYVSVHEGVILRLSATDGEPEIFAITGGRPLGMVFDAQQNLLVADAYIGLLRISPDGKVTVLADHVDGSEILYANNVDVAHDGKVYFSDASTKFGAKAWGGSYPASLLDLMEHGGHGRLLQYDPDSGKVKVLVEGLQFANGVALAHDEQSVLVNETGLYRVMRYWLKGKKQGQFEVLIDELPGFPDNLNRGLDGRYWLGLVSPRKPLLDGMSDKPFLRKVVQRLPASMRPKASNYSHVIAIDDAGNVVRNLQNPDGYYPTNTSVYETLGMLYIGSLTADKLARLKLQ